MDSKCCHSVTLRKRCYRYGSVLLVVQDGQERDVDGWLRRKFEGRIKDVEVVEREDLDLVSAARADMDFL